MQTVFSLTAKINMALAKKKQSQASRKRVSAKYGVNVDDSDYNSSDYEDSDDDDSGSD